MFGLVFTRPRVKPHERFNKRTTQRANDLLAQSRKFCAAGYWIAAAANGRAALEILIRPLARDTSHRGLARIVENLKDNGAISRCVGNRALRCIKFAGNVIHGDKQPNRGQTTCFVSNVNFVIAELCGRRPTPVVSRVEFFLDAWLAKPAVIVGGWSAAPEPPSYEVDAAYDEAHEALADCLMRWAASGRINMRPEKRGQTGQALGRSRGGFSTKVHVGVDALGNPVRLLLSEGQKADITYAPALLSELDFQAVLADKGYDSDDFVRLIVEQHQAQAVIPPKKNRKQQRDYDRHLYKQRNLVERFINLAKHFRRVATRYEKTARNFLAFWNFASICILLR